MFWFLDSFTGGSLVGGSKRSFFQQSQLDQLHEIQHIGKTDLLIEKRKLYDFGRIIFLPNAENRAKICQETAEIIRCIP